MGYIKSTDIAYIHKGLKWLAKEFDLKYDSKWFSYLMVSRRALVLNDYLTGCPEFNHFGKSEREKIANLDKFLASKEYNGRINSVMSGCVKLKNEFEHEVKLADYIEDKDVRKEYLALLSQAKTKYKQGILILIAEPRNQREVRPFLDVLSHEWKHILLHQNKLYREFFGLGQDHWLIDEGITTYFDMLTTPQRFWDVKYHREGLNWKKILKNIKDPYERRKVIISHFGSFQ